jgi:hypothetical protein
MSSFSRVIVFALPLVLVAAFRGGQGDAPSQQAQSAAMARYEAAKTVCDLSENKLKMGRDDFEGDAAAESRFLWSSRLADAAVAAGVVPAADAYREHVARMEKFAASIESLQVRGRASEIQVATAQFFVADAKAQLERVAH